MSKKLDPTEHKVLTWTEEEEHRLTIYSLCDEYVDLWEPRMSQSTKDYRVNLLEELLPLVGEERVELLVRGGEIDEVMLIGPLEKGASGEYME